MKTWIGIVTVTIASLSLSGCSMCCGPYDYDYPTFGGKHQRASANWGRVGSILSDPNAFSGGPSADSNLEAPPEPRVVKPFNDEEDELEMEKYRQQLDDRLNDGLDNLESIEPDESLPGVADENETASRFIRNRLRGLGQGWR